LEQKAAFPMGGTARFTVHVPKLVSFTVKVRVPPGCDYIVTGTSREGIAHSPAGLVGKVTDRNPESGYFFAKAEWKDGDWFAIELEPTLRVLAGEHTNAGKVAIMYGPLVLAADEGANPERKPMAGLSIPNKLDNSVIEVQPAGAPGELFSVSIPACTGEGGQTSTTLKMVPFALIGADNSAYQVWFAEAKPNCGK
jgi:uncharacterized protein